jgi:hypothetical protein
MKPNTDVVTTFAKFMRARGPWTLTAIHPDRVPLTREQAAKKDIALDTQVQRVPTNTFSPATVEEMWGWVEQWNSTHGVYFMANPPRRQAYRRRASEFMRKDEFSLDVLALQYVAADLDPPKGAAPDEWYQFVLSKFGSQDMDLKPTFVWRSGYGTQAMWQVKPAVELHDNDDVRAAKLVTKGMLDLIHEKLGITSDAVGSVDHLFRLPGTINWPNAVKRAAGRKPILTGEFFHDATRRYPVDAFPKAEAPLPRLTRGLIEPLGGWDAPENEADAVLLLKHTTIIAKEGVAKTALRVALLMRDFGISPDLAFALMWEHWKPRCEYDWDEHELRDKVTRAYPLAQNDPGCRTRRYRMTQTVEDFSHD